MEKRRVLEVVLMIGGVEGANGYLVQVIVSGGKRCFCIRAGIGRREASSIVAGRDLG
jgi:hypothetical protein